ncbi:MAG: DegT/DnrJ/EryC1/StrS family aminotransferase [Ignavibacteria bacterium]|jgi:dTDP-4-amino-4,6-dideoxygalactose transaminase|nr:DegT/DnrJ/EryC1/StrS family aminotransferase [Ignavibacteria bacterium]
MKIPITKTSFRETDFDAVRQVLESGWVVQGPKVKEFEDMWNSFTGSLNSVAVSNCTNALHLSLIASGIKRDDEVIVPSFTWIATANAVEYCGAKPVFCDIDLNTFNIDAAQIRNLLTEKTKAVIPVHLFGLSADMDLISEICCSEKLKIIEDAACGFGAFYGGKHVGNFGDFGCFSFHPRKAITTGEGGMITINNEETAEYLRSLRDHGALISDLQRHSGMQPYLLPDFSHLGYNYRMTDIQAVLGLMQMKRADDILNKRAEIARKYDMGLKDNPFLRSPSYGEKYRHGYQSYVCMFGTEDISLDSYVRINKLRNEFMKYLFDNGISTRPGTHAVHAQNYYSRKYNIKSEDYPVSLFADRCSVSLPVFPSMTNEETDYVINTINNYKHDCI